MKPVEQSPKAIGGWLLLPALALCFPLIGLMLKTYHIIDQSSSIRRIHINWYACIYDFLILLMIALVSWSFFRKRVFAPSLFVSYILLMWIFWAIAWGMSPNMDEPLIGLAVHLLIILPYMVFSKRAAATFVLEPTNSFDHFLSSINTLPAALLAFLRKTRWFIIIVILVYFSSMVVLNSAVRALYFDGNLAKTWNYIF